MKKKFLLQTKYSIQIKPVTVESSKIFYNGERIVFNPNEHILFDRHENAKEKAIEILSKNIKVKRMGLDSATNQLLNFLRKDQNIKPESYKIIAQ